MTEVFSADLTVCIDAANLSGYLALAPTLHLLEAHDVRPAWLPMVSPLARLSSKRPNEPMEDPLAAYKARRAEARRKWAESELARDCARLGITPQQGARHFDGTHAAIGLMFVTEQGGDAAAYLERVYECAFRQSGNVADIEVIGDLVDDRRFFAYAHSTGRHELEALQGKLLDAGVFSSPAYVYKGEVFQGRQHLPLIAWYLGGSRGTPPV